MKKKILVVTFLVFMMLVLTHYTSAISISDEQQNLLVKSKEYIDLNYENTTTYGFMTFGPRDLTISKITYQNGTFFFNLMSTIELRFVYLPFMRPIAFITLNKIDFTVEYKQDKPQYSKVNYITNIVEIVNGNLTNNRIDITNEKHTVIVEGFRGGLVLFKRSVVLPPSFDISGVCDHYTLIQ